ncbi:hypothetical protein Tco_0023766, partial [Tanacetum coccineum]
IDKLVDGDEDEDSYASAFADSVINNDDDDDTGSKLEPGSHKEYPEHVFDDEAFKKEKEVVKIMKETNVDDTSAKKNTEVVTEKEVVDIKRGLIRSHIKTKFITREFFVDKIKEVIQHYDKIIPELTITKTNEMLKKGDASLEFAAHGPMLIEELFQKHMQNTTLNLYPKIKSSTATTSSTDLQHQMYLSMKTKPQDQAADPEIWDILKAKFKKS